jgi:NitT/TauT family transport system permease protein
MGKLLKLIVPPIVTLVVVVVAAQWVIRALKVPAYLVPPPTEIYQAGRDQAQSLLQGLWITGKAAGIGFLLAAVVGVICAVLLSTSKIIERAFYPYTLFFQTVPVVAIAPLLVIWCGQGLRAVAVSAFIVAVFPVIANTLTGLRSVDPALRDLFRLYGARSVATLFKLKLPAAMPNIVTGLRIASGLSVIGAIVGEFVAGQLEGSGEGLGITIIAANRQGNTDQVFAAVLVASLLGLALFAVVNLLGWVTLRRWHASET